MLTDHENRFDTGNQIKVTALRVALAYPGTFGGVAVQSLYFQPKLSDQLVGYIQ